MARWRWRSFRPTASPCRSRRAGWRIPRLFFIASCVITLVGGTMFLMWLGEQITARGIGNGISLIIFVGIVAEIPAAWRSSSSQGRSGAISTPVIIGVIVMVVAVIAFVVFMERALRKIHIQYPRRQVGMKVYDGGSSHLPIKVNPAGVIPAIFASSLLLLPTTIGTFSGAQTGAGAVDAAGLPSATASRCTCCSWRR
jgi:preprotein translocase subunit SecY